MKRWTVVVAAVVAAVAAAVAIGGCSSLSLKNPFAARKGPEPTTLPQRQWVELKRENAARLAGEGIPRGSDAATTPAVKPKGNELKQFFGFVEFVFYKLPRQAIDFYLGKTPGRYARMMEDDQSADVRRTGILRLVNNYEFARKDPYTRRYWQIAQGDPDDLVRVAAIRALDRSRKSSVTPIAIKALDDNDPLLRLEAAKALANVPDETAIPALIRHMNSIIEVRGESGRLERVQESRDVRVACADALRNFPNRDVTTALVDVLQDKDFEVSWQARKSLVLLTGHDYKYDQNAWRDYFTKAEKPFG